MIIIFKNCKEMKFFIKFMKHNLRNVYCKSLRNRTSENLEELDKYINT